MKPNKQPRNLRRYDDTPALNRACFAGAKVQKIFEMCKKKNEKIARTGHSTLLMAVKIPPNGTTGMRCREMDIETLLTIGGKEEEKREKLKQAQIGIGEGAFGAFLAAGRG